MLYADDILLIAASINELQSLFRNCEKELRCLDMRIRLMRKNHVVCALAQDLMLLVLVLLLQIYLLLLLLFIIIMYNKITSNA